MKVAVCFSGGLRNYKHTFENFKKYLLDPLNADVFFYGCENRDGIEKNIIDFNQIYSPKSMYINTKVFYNELSSKCPGMLTSFIPQVFNIKKCKKLVEEYEIENNFKYDLIIRLRLDCFFFREISEDEIKDALNGYMIVPKDWAFKEVHPIAETDQFMLCNRKNYEIYASLYDAIYNYFPNLKHPETIIGSHLDKHKLPVKQVNRHYVFEYFNSDPNIQPTNFKALGEWQIPNGYNEHNYRKFFD